MVHGYKCFNKDLINNYGMQFDCGKIYKVEGNVKFGNNGNGFHFCSNIEDTLRYFDSFNNEIIICEVIGFGKIKSYEDNYNEYYDMYVASELLITKVLTREEIIKLGLDLPINKVNRFIQGFKLTKEEIQLFREKFANFINVINALAYYQEGNLNVYNEYYKCYKKLK